MESESGSGSVALSDVLRHPLRVRIIEACSDWGTLSPVEILNRGLCADVETVRGKTHKQALSHIAYHCRKLEEAGLLELVFERPVRGATEHFYRANAEAYFSDEEWGNLSSDERRDISRVMWQRFVAQVEGAMRGNSFDGRADRWLAWGPLDLDERGWKELIVSVASSYAEVEQIRRDARTRLSDSGEEPMRATYGLFAFESPRRKAPTPDDDLA